MNDNAIALALITTIPATLAAIAACISSVMNGRNSRLAAVQAGEAVKISKANQGHIEEKAKEIHDIVNGHTDKLMKELDQLRKAIVAANVNLAAVRKREKSVRSARAKAS